MKDLEQQAKEIQKYILENWDSRSYNLWTWILTVCEKPVLNLIDWDELPAEYYEKKPKLKEIKLAYPDRIDMSITTYLTYKPLSSNEETP